jgi:hypothetical protein
MMQRLIRKIAAVSAACAALFLPGAGRAADGVSLQAGYGNGRTSIIRAGATWQWRREWPAGQDWRLAGYWEATAGVWDNREESTAELALTPVFRLERGASRERSPYVEAAIGFHLVQTHISAGRVFSTAFQFGEHIGVGYRFGEGGRFDLGARVQHISNGGIRKPNPGFNLVVIRLQYYLDGPTR